VREDGHQITYISLRFGQERTAFLGAKGTWKELDAPDWRKEGDEEPYDAIKGYCSFLHKLL